MPFIDLSSAKLFREVKNTLNLITFHRSMYLAFDDHLDNWAERVINYSP